MNDDAAKKGPAPPLQLQPKQRGRPFSKGQSGNPNGKRPGTKNRATQLIERLMGDQAEAVVQATIKRALAGSTDAMKLILDRLAPARRDRPVSFEMPEIATADDITKALAAVAGQVAAGELTPAEGVQVAGLIEGQRRAIETGELMTRLAALEEKVGINGQS